MVAQSRTRVTRNTDPESNDRIRQQTEMNIAYYMNHPRDIDRRLQELDEEWDVERVLETGSSALSLFGLVVGQVRRRWLLLPLVVQGFFLQHAIQGWCPPLSVIRRLGLRTRDEIATERFALLSVRGDLKDFLKEGGGDPAKFVKVASGETETPEAKSSGAKKK